MSSSMRQSGRTTTMLHEAAQAKRQGHIVRVVSPNAVIMRQVMQLAVALGLLYTQGAPQQVLLGQHDFITVPAVIKGRIRGYQGKLFEDHTVWEMLSLTDEQAYSHEVNLAMTPEPLADFVDQDEQERLRLREEIAAIQAEQDRLTRHFNPSS